MKQVSTIAEIRDWRRTIDGTVGLVPTMGYLHDGHLSLVRTARAAGDRVAVSIFVNPSQFNRPDDLERYPRDLDRDLELLAAEGCDLVFTPATAEIYPPGFQTWIEPGSVSVPNEGAHRPGHFRGVATVVAKLFAISHPHRAYFGRKDAQQLAVVRILARDLNLPVEIVGVDTAREADGLAMSSRNALLRPNERPAAAVLYRALCSARQAFHDGEDRAAALRERMRQTLAEEPQVTADYISVADPDTFEELELVDRPAVLSLAANLGKVRLIDNILIEETN